MTRGGWTLRGGDATASHAGRRGSHVHLHASRGSLRRVRSLAHDGRMRGYQGARVGRGFGRGIRRQRCVEARDEHDQPEVSGQRIDVAATARSAAATHGGGGGRTGGSGGGWGRERAAVAVATIFKSRVGAWR